MLLARLGARWRPTAARRTVIRLPAPALLLDGVQQVLAGRAIPRRDAVELERVPDFGLQLLGRLAAAGAARARVASSLSGRRHRGDGLGTGRLTTGRISGRLHRRRRTDAARLRTSALCTADCRHRMSTVKPSVNREPYFDRLCSVFGSSQNDL